MGESLEQTDRRWLRRAVLELLADGQPRSVPVLARLLGAPTVRVQGTVWNARRDRLLVSDGRVRGALYTLPGFAYRLNVAKKSAPPVPVVRREWFHV